LDILELHDENGPRPPGPFSSSSHQSAILAGIAIATSSVFIGRAEELGRLSELLERAEQGRRAVALVAGDAGVGKTRLLDELADRARGRGMRVLVGGCMETGDVGLPYVPYVDAFRDVGTHAEEAELATALAGAVPNLRRLLPVLGEERGSVPSPNDEFEQVELFGGIHSLLVRLSELAPLLLVIEDLHWADRSTRDLLAFLVRTLRSGRFALIASYRSDELHRRHPLRPLLGELVRMSDIERIELPPFNRAELSAHLDALVGEKVDGAAVDRILVRSEGNAFFSEELVAAGAISADVVLPEALADVLRARIDALPEQAQQLVKVASVAGRRVSHQLLVAATELPPAEVEKSIREAIAGQVIVADRVTETYRFRHALLQEAVYGDLLPGERSRVHATYARLLAESGSPAELAHHAVASHDLAGALDALVRAANDATAVSAPAEALGHLTQALGLWDQVPDAAAIAGHDHAAILLKAAAAAGNSGEFRRAVTLAREAVAEIDPDEDAGRAALAHERLGEHLYQMGTMADEMLDTFRRAVDLVPAEPPTALRARVTAGLARALTGISHYEEARKWCDEALAAARATDAAEDETHALITLAILEVRFDNPDLARSLLREARARAAAVGTRVQELRAQYSLAALELDVGDLTAACEALEEAVAIAERTGLTWSQYGINSGALRSYAYYAAGKWDEAEHVAAAIDERMSGAATQSAAALFIEVGRGQAHAAERLERLEPISREDDWAAYLAGGCGADLALWRGDLDGARALAQRTLSSLDEADESWDLSAIWPATLGLAAEAEVADRARVAGDQHAETESSAAGGTLLELARTAVRRAEAAGHQIGPEARAWLARAGAEWARLEGRPDPDLWRAAADAFGYGYVYEEARCRWRLAEALLVAGMRDEAGEQARTAHAVAVRLGAEPLREQVEALVRRGRLDVPGVTRKQGLAGLTARELEVLRLVAKGRSNQKIAEALFISRKTASVHVSHILTKLGVHTRVEAAAAAHRMGLDNAGTPEEATEGPGAAEGL
jgi:DNA-binding CsgD family transcriptional regulator/tetratricopeptide (TPR) repeat protein